MTHENRGLPAYTTVGCSSRFAKLFDCISPLRHLSEYLLSSDKNICAFLLAEWVFYELNFVCPERLRIFISCLEIYGV